MPRQTVRVRNPWSDPTKPKMLVFSVCGVPRKQSSHTLAIMSGLGGPAFARSYSSVTSEQKTFTVGCRSNVDKRFVVRADFSNFPAVDLGKSSFHCFVGDVTGGSESIRIATRIPRAFAPNNALNVSKATPHIGITEM